MNGPLEFPSWINPEIVPGLPFRWYGLMYLIAFGVTYLLFRLQVKRRKLDITEDDISGFFFWAILGLLVGARIFAALVYDTTNRYWERPWLIFWPFDDSGRFIGLQGMSFHGGAIGLILTCLVYARVKKIDYLDWADMIAAGVPLGYTFGRLGNFINAELYGRVTTGPLGMIFPGAATFSAREPWVQEVANKVGIPIASMNDMLNLPRHPSQLYEAAFEGILLWLILWFIVKNHKPFKGFVMASYLVGYGAIRFFIEYFRTPDADLGFILTLGDKNHPFWMTGSWLNFSMGQLLCLLMVAAGIALAFLFAAMARREAARGKAPKAAQASPDMRKIKRKIK